MDTRGIRCVCPDHRRGYTIVIERVEDMTRALTQAWPGRELRPDDLERKSEGWMRELIDDPDLEAAADLLAWMPEAALPAIPRVMPAKPANLWRTISNIIFYGALLLIVMGTVVLGGKSGGRTQFFGLSYFQVLSGSMERVIPRGSLVITREVPASQISAGDVITFMRSDQEIITHEVLRVIPNFDGGGATGFQTKGTENPMPDPDIVGAANVLGVVKVHINGLGFTLRYIADNIKYVFLLFIVILLGSIAIRVFLGERKKSSPGLVSPKRL